MFPGDFARPGKWLREGFAKDERRARDFGPALFLCLRLARVYLCLRAVQVPDHQERAQANENCHADGERKPGKFNLLGVEAKGAHCVARQLRLRPTIQRDIAMERRPPGVEWWVVPRLIFVRHRTMNRQANGMESARGARPPSRVHTADKGLEAAASTRHSSFALVRPGDLQDLPHRLLDPRCDRFRRPGKSNGPSPFAPSLNVQGNDTHSNSGFFDLTPSIGASRSRANGDGRNCVPKKDRADFLPVLEFGHTMRAAHHRRRISAGAHAMA